MAAGLGVDAGRRAVMSTSAVRDSVANVDTLVDSAPPTTLRARGVVGKLRRAKARSTPFGCVIPTPFVWPWRCRPIRSTPSMRQTTGADAREGVQTRSSARANIGLGQ
jgi:hypothetical protein